MNRAELAKETARHFDEANRLSRNSHRIRHLAEKGLIEHLSAIQMQTDIDRQSILETEKALELQSEYLAIEKN